VCRMQSKTLEGGEGGGGGGKEGSNGRRASSWLPGCGPREGGREAGRKGRKPYLCRLNLLGLALLHRSDLCRCTEIAERNAERKEDRKKEMRGNREKQIVCPGISRSLPPSLPPSLEFYQSIGPVPSGRASPPPPPRTLTTTFPPAAWPA